MVPAYIAKSRGGGAWDVKNSLKVEGDLPRLFLREVYISATLFCFCCKAAMYSILCVASRQEPKVLKAHLPHPELLLSIHLTSTLCVTQGQSCWPWHRALKKQS